MEAAVYRARRPAETPLYVLMESLYASVKGAWEDLFERRYGFWRGLLDGVVARYLDGGLFERGFARIRCPDCAAEYLLAFITEPASSAASSTTSPPRLTAPPRAALPLPSPYRLPHSPDPPAIGAAFSAPARRSRSSLVSTTAP